MSAEPRFAHASEAELAGILDYYKVAWEYEPHVFPIRWNTDGVVVESFTPDFFLPELELYVELTTLKQSLVRKKNRKLRHLRELYPMVRIKLFYARDFKALLLKYGRLDAAASLIGIDGQATPRHARVDDGPTQATHRPARSSSPARSSRWLRWSTDRRPGGPGDARLSTGAGRRRELHRRGHAAREGRRAGRPRHRGLSRTARSRS